MNITCLDSHPMTHPPTDGMSRRHVVFGATAAAVASLAACGGAALFAPFFTFNFVGTVDGQEVSISFQPDAASVGQSSGRFAATSNMNVTNLPQVNFSGTFDGRNMRLTLVAALAPLATRYDGAFTDDDTVAFTTNDVDRRGFVVRRRTT